MEQQVSGWQGGEGMDSPRALSLESHEGWGSASAPTNSPDILSWEASDFPLNENNTGTGI